jgi:uncharacterized protein YjdB
MKKVSGVFVIVMVFALLFAACPDPNGGGGDDNEGPVIPVQRVTVAKPGAGTVLPTVPELIYVETSVTFVATVVPSTASDTTVTWESGDPEIVTVVDGEVTGVAEGTTTITVTTNGKKADGLAAIFTFEVKVEIDPENIPAYLKIFNQADAGAGSTEAKGNVPATDFNAQGRLLISNKSTAGGWGTETQKVKGNTIVYLTRPLEAPFSISARVKISAMTAGEGTDNGFFVGAFTDPTVDTQPTPATTATIIYLAGVNTSTTGRRSVYATRDSGGTNNSATGTTQFVDRTDKEYLFIVRRTDAVYTMDIKDDAQEDSPSRSPYPVNRGANSTPATEIHPELSGAKPLYLGIVVSGVDVEISSIEITQGTDTVYASPAAEPTPIPAAISVTITNAPGDNVVSVGAAIGMTAAVNPPEAIQTVTWSIDPEAPAIATIDPATGVVTGVGAGTVQVYATSASTPTVKSAPFPVTVSLEQEVLQNNRSWDFTKQPTGVDGESTFNRDIYYGQGMTLLGSNRSSGIIVKVTRAGPEDLNTLPVILSTGCIQPNGTVPDGYARIDEVQGPFDITLKYEADSGSQENPVSPARYTTIKIKPEGATEYGAGINGPASSYARDNKSFTYSYTGTDKVSILLVADVNPGKIHDVIIAYTGP